MGGGAPGTKAEMLDHASCIIMHNEALQPREGHIRRGIYAAADEGAHGGTGGLAGAAAHAGAVHS